jgi:hypothetical protein
LPCSKWSISGKTENIPDRTTPETVPMAQPQDNIMSEVTGLTPHESDLLMEAPAAITQAFPMSPPTRGFEDVHDELLDEGYDSDGHPPPVDVQEECMMNDEFEEGEVVVSIPVAETAVEVPLDVSPMSVMSEEQCQR